MVAVPEGYDVAKVEQWISENVSELSPPLNWIRLEGGHSNLTYRIEDIKSVTVMKKMSSVMMNF